MVTALAKKGRTIVVTDQRIIICSPRLKTVLREYPRDTPLGPARGMLWHRIDGLGEHLYIPVAPFRRLCSVVPVSPVRTDRKMEARK